MLRFLKKLYICLAEPKKIGFFMGEKLWKSFTQLLFLTLIAISPVIINFATINSISSSSVEILEKTFMIEKVDANIALSNGVLSGDGKIVTVIDEAIIYVNPTDESLKLNEYSYLPVYELSKTGVKISYLGIVVKEMSYEELEYSDLSFEKISNSDYIEFARFIHLLDIALEEVKFVWSAANILVAFIEAYITSILLALILAWFTSFVNRNVSFKFRFKGALDSQFIVLLFVLLSYLFNLYFLRYIGIAFSSFYIIRALASILRIEVRKANNTKEGE